MRGGDEKWAQGVWNWDPEPDANCRGIVTTLRRVASSLGQRGAMGGF